MRDLRHRKHAVDSESGCHVVPAPLQQPPRHFGTHDRALRIGHFRCGTAVRTDAERERPAADAERKQSLPTFPGRGRPDGS
jgi:hypothetical protein